MLSENSDFTSVDLSEFLDKDALLEEESETGIVVLTPRQKVIVDELKQRVSMYNPELLEQFNKRMADLRRLNADIAEFPSLLAKAYLTAETRTPQNLVEL